MKKIIFFFLFSIFINAQENNNSDCTSIYLIRHAEKDRSKKDNNNPHLNLSGQKRALKWKSFFKNINFEKFYSTNYYRTLETIKPISQGNEIILYNPSNIDYKKFIIDNFGKTVLVVGHSNTIPTFANEVLGENIYEQIEDSNNSNLYVINFCNESEKISSIYFVE